LRDIARLRFLVVPTFGMRRQTHATQIGDNNSVIVYQHPRHGRPHVAGIAKPVQQDNGRAFAAYSDMDRRIVYFNFLDSETFRK
jgi:hypothetical protein